MIIEQCLMNWVWTDKCFLRVQWKLYCMVFCFKSFFFFASANFCEASCIFYGK